jgi:RNA polymerase sigma factor (sigma-70 family)
LSLSVVGKENLHHMTDWTQASERYLVYCLRRLPEHAGNQPLYDELWRRLGRYLPKSITIAKFKQHEDEIKSETILRLLYPTNEFRGNSIQFKKFIRKTLLTVYIEIVKHDRLLLSLDDPMYQTSSQQAVTAVIDMLTAWAVAGPIRTSQDWDEAQDTVQWRTPEDIYTHQEMASFIDQARGQLSARCRELLFHEEEMGLPQQEIARILEMSHSSVRVALARCRQRLIRRLIELLAKADAGLDLIKIEEALAHLSSPHQSVLSAWWQGETNWKKLGQLTVPASSQEEVKQVMAEGLLQMFSNLSEAVGG